MSGRGHWEPWECDWIRSRIGRSRGGCGAGRRGGRVLERGTGAGIGSRGSVTGSAAGSDVPAVDAVQVVGEDVYWIEGRASGDVLVRSRGLAGVEDVLP